MTRYEVPIQTCHIVKVLDPKLKSRIKDFEFRIGAIHSGYPDLAEWHPAISPQWGIFCKAPVETSIIYKGNTGTWSYSHHPSIIKYADRYIASWSNGLQHEDRAGQEVHYAWSSDGIRWSEPEVLVHTPVDSKLVRHNAGLYADQKGLHCFVGVAKEPTLKTSDGDMCVLKDQPVRLDVYETADLNTWTLHKGICENIYLFEAPRKTCKGTLLCCGFDLSDHHAKILRWSKGMSPYDPPQIIDLPPSKEGVLPEQGTWYQTDDGRIWMFQRDGSLHGTLGLTWSDDEGLTWSELLHTDFPNSFSRAHAGRLIDGRYYIVGNNYSRFLDRRTLLIALSEDGYRFDRQYVLVEGPTTRRINGQHKEDGYHYPNCFVDGSNLMTVYSVNKEDIAIAIVNISQIE